MGILKQKIKSAGLLESLVAMVIVIICMGIATMIYVNVMQGDNKRQQLKANLTLHAIADSTVRQKLFIDDKSEAGNLIIEKTLRPYNNSANLQWLNLKAFDKNSKKLLAERNELILEE
jgi:Tfp pilus assembly protein PilV